MVWRSLTALRSSLGILIINKASMSGFILLIGFVVMALLADLIAPYNPYERVSQPFEPSSGKH
jgi:ABC-type antimicrobial peptide transport system permease subunit